MGFLAPLLLLAGVTLAVPVFLHLFQRHDARRFAFPALRYLQRAEREHARTIRVRQLLLLALRLAILALVVLAAARLYLAGSGGGHEPTALALVIDNSASSGVVVGDARVLDPLKELALESVAEATDDDLIWVIRAGTPWEAVTPVGPEEARRRIRATEVSAARADLPRALSRAQAQLRGAGMPRGEIHLLSDLQASNVPEQHSYTPDPDLLTVWHDSRNASEGTPPPNRAVTGVALGGGVAPLSGERTELAVTVRTHAPAPGDSVALRLFVDDRMRGATLAPPDATVVMSAGPFAGGWVAGHVAADPDALRADDRRYFAFPVRPPTRVALAGPSGDGGATSNFVREALAVMAEAGRAEPVAVARADVVVSVGGAALERTDSAAVIVLPPEDPTLLPGLNRRLAQAGIPWRLEERNAPGEATLESTGVPVTLDGVRVYRHYGLIPSAEGGTPSRVRASLSSGEPWMVSGQGAAIPYLLLASPLSPDATTLPVSAVMIPLMEWMFGGWSQAGSTPGSLAVGDLLPSSPGIDSVETPDGTILDASGTPRPPRARDPGLYRLLQGDSVVAVVAVNVAPAESDLTPASPGLMETLLGDGARRVSDPSRWRRSIFDSPRGPELWWPSILGALVLLLVEGWVAASGGPRRQDEKRQTVKRSTEERRARL